MATCNKCVACGAPHGPTFNRAYATHEFLEGDPAVGREPDEAVANGARLASVNT
jgi:hypothetical protein